MRVEEAVRQRFEVSQVIGDEYIVRCPSPDHEDRRPSAAINVRKGLWTCYSCGDGGRVKDLLDGVHITDEPETDELLSELQANLVVAQRSIWDEEYHSESWLARFDNDEAKRYWTERGLTPAAISEFNFGFDMMEQQATYPLRDYKGRILGVIRRNLDEVIGKPQRRGRRIVETPKYEYPEGSDVSQCLFGYERIANRSVTVVWVTEGAVDAAALWDVGHQAVGQYGIRLHEAQIDLLRRLDPAMLVLCYDQDTEGQRSISRTLNGYHDKKGRWHPPLDLSFTNVFVASWNSRLGKDPAAIPLQIRPEIIETKPLLHYLA